MKLEEQVCSLELAKKLKELGVKQESVFYWGDFNGYWPLLIMKRPDGTIARYDMDWDYADERHLVDALITYSAFTVAELGELLPKGYWDEFSVNAGFEIGYGQGRPIGAEAIDRYFVLGRNETNARAKMLIHLLENNLL